ncbi:LysR family transcriptional regulator [Paracoccus aerodenitrificans]|uniref:LysR family transcriptional regulator n=1 Tax=Paracoccus aerodenitrificans TaxID=3017781 RepID=UPI0022F058B6|nr:LysR family transcriptional regulator [Paracoccus aerodenitrificans]WBU63015.1 LysR family transcriptional regulator [Paracoccus aerodenitrificans]
MQSSIRHLRMFQHLAATHSVTRTAELCHVSQPAVTQAMNKLEQEAGIALLERTSQGIFLTRAGDIVARRTERALSHLDAAMSDMARNIKFQATRPQLTALIAVTETENFTLAARKLGLAQPTVHRSTSLLEQSAGMRFFERTAHGLIATRAARQLAHAARLAFSEIDQAAAELSAMAGGARGRIVIGALPLSQASLLPETMLRFRSSQPDFEFEVVDGCYDELLSGLRRGEIDVLIGALRPAAATDDIQQERLFDDSVVIVSRKDHPILSRNGVSPEELADYPWVVPRRGTQIWSNLEPILCEDREQKAIVTSSATLLRELLRGSDHLGALSRLQAEAEAKVEALAIVPIDIPDSNRPVGLTIRTGWQPTGAQQEFLDMLRQTSVSVV